MGVIVNSRPMSVTHKPFRHALALSIIAFAVSTYQSGAAPSPSSPNIGASRSIKTDTLVMRDVTVSRIGHDQDGQETTFVLSYPQIVKPTTEAQRDWNRRRANEHKIPKDVEHSDTDWTYSYEMGLVTSKIISMQQSNFMYGHGTPHGYGGTTSSNWLLGETREMRPEDMFSSSAQWPQALSRICADEIAKLNNKDMTNKMADPAQLLPMVIEAHRWFLTDAGLMVQFDTYELGGHTDGEAQIQISWNRLKPYLNADFSKLIAQPH